MFIPAPVLRAAKDVASQVADAGLTVVEHVFVHYQRKVMHRLSVRTPLFDESANCYGIDTNVFFPEPKENSGRVAEFVFVDGNETVVAQASYAKRVCRGCPFMDACMEYAVAAGEYGVWGGTTHSERRNLRTHRQQMVSPRIFAQIEVQPLVLASVHEVAA